MLRATQAAKCIYKYLLFSHPSNSILDALLLSEKKKRTEGIHVRFAACSVKCISCYFYACFMLNCSRSTGCSSKIDMRISMNFKLVIPLEVYIVCFMSCVARAAGCMNMFSPFDHRTPFQLRLFPPIPRTHYRLSNVHSLSSFANLRLPIFMAASSPPQQNSNI
jgi:hypothetical protein